MDDRLVYQVLCNKLIACTFDAVSALNRQQRVFGNIANSPGEKSEYVFRPPFDISLPGGKVLNGQFDLFRHRVRKSYEDFATRTGRSWIVRTDIRSYYPSVDHITLEEFLKERSWFSDESSQKLLMQCLAKWASDEGKGIPVGYECSDYIGNLYACDLDDALRDFRVHRYVDDIYIFVDGFEQVKDVLYRIDKTLQSLGLQRNTSKTMHHRLKDFNRDQLEKMLSENLSIFAEERHDDTEEAKRQDELLEILEESFDPHCDEVLFSSKIIDIRRVAFVLNRLSRPDEDIKELAYEILDFDLKYAYHALSYLYLNHCDTRLANKLKSVLSAKYEPRALKALALAFLSKLDPPLVQHYLEVVTESADKNDWHLIRSLMQDAIEPELSSYSTESLAPLMAWDNPFVQVYARWLFFRIGSDPAIQCVSIDKMFDSEHRIVQCLGIYLAHRFGLESHASTTLLDTDLQSLFSEDTLDDIEFCRRCFSEVFQITLELEFPFERYVGTVNETIQILRNVYATREQGLEEFTENLLILVERILIRSAKSQHGDQTVNDFDDAMAKDGDYELRKFAELLRKNVNDARLFIRYGKNGDQQHLIRDFNKWFSVFFNRLHRREGLRMRNGVFISYAHDDGDKWEKMVRQHLAPYVNYSNLSVWSDKDIAMGEDWDDEIKQALARAKVAILLVSPAFLASNYIYNDELPDIMKSSQRDGLTISWIHVIPSAVFDIPLGRLQAAHRNPHRTLSGMDEEELNQTLVDICRKVSLLMGA